MEWIEIMKKDILIVAIILAVLALLLIYRLARGPNAVDRLAAADSIEVIVGIIMVLFGCYQGNDFYVDVGLVIALLGFIETILVSKYLEGKL
jgi:multisubunit Na+/H+ antiporter MnhF subunit